MHEEKSELKVSASSGGGALKNLAVHLRGTGSTVILATWILSVGAISIFAEGAGLKSGQTLLTVFIGFYLGIISRDTT